MSSIVYLEKQDTHSTLTTWFYCHFWLMWAAEQQGKEAYLNWTTGKFLQSYEDDKKFAEIPNAYHWYFKQPMVEIPPPQIECETWVWENYADPSPIPFMAQPLHVIKDYYKRHLHFNDETNRRGQLLVDKYGIDFSKTIGVTWRGTDIYLDGRPRIPIERYFKHIDRFLEEVPDLRIACTSEEETILDPLFKRYGERSFIIEEFYQSPFYCKDNPERFSPMSGYLRGLQPALMVWLFSKCAYYIKNRSSTGAVASWLSDGFIVCIGHPETLGHDNKFDKDEIKGVWYDV